MNPAFRFLSHGLTETNPLSAPLSAPLRSPDDHRYLDFVEEGRVAWYDLQNDACVGCHES